MVAEDLKMLLSDSDGHWWTEQVLNSHWNITITSGCWNIIYGVTNLHSSNPEVIFKISRMLNTRLLNYQMHWLLKLIHYIIFPGNKI
jgi:hypothetical protein